MLELYSELDSGEAPTTPSSISGGVSWLTGKRWTQEDTHVLHSDLKLDFPEQLAGCPFKQFALFGVYDGHGGPRVSAMLHRWLVRDLLSRASELVDASRLVPVLRATFRRVAEHVDERCSRSGFSDGSTAAVIVIADGFLYSANVGDSEAVLARVLPDGRWQAHELTMYQNASNEEEKQAIIARGGAVSDGRVGGCLALSRAFGDIEYKAPWNGKEESFITAEPYISVTKLTRGCRAVVVACDGLWDVLSHPIVVQRIKPSLRNGEDAFTIARHLTLSARDLESADNITSIVILFEYPPEDPHPS